MGLFFLNRSFPLRALFFLFFKVVSLFYFKIKVLKEGEIISCTGLQMQSALLAGCLEVFFLICKASAG